MANRHSDDPWDNAAGIAGAGKYLGTDVHPYVTVRGQSWE